MAYSKRKAIMFEQLVKTYIATDESNITPKEKRKVALECVAMDCGVKIDSIKRAERYARKVWLK
tara:strand:+ start:5172 stop:5363 length:192 start_codon:yes stop_codon:yes gene_type:complete